jgi:hypothetical protein
MYHLEYVGVARLWRRLGGPLGHNRAVWLELWLGDVHGAWGFARTPDVRDLQAAGGQNVVIPMSLCCAYFPQKRSWDGLGIGCKSNALQQVEPLDWSWRNLRNLPSFLAAKIQAPNIHFEL